MATHTTLATDDDEAIIKTGDLLEISTGNVDDVYFLQVRGDVNGDGQCNIADVKLLVSYLVGTASIDENYLMAGDYNQDGIIKMSDVIYILKNIN